MYMARNVVNACTATGTMTITSATTGDDNHQVGGIVGEALQTIVASCVSMPTIVSNGKVGGIISRINASDTYNEKQSRLEHSVFAGHIDATQAEKAGGLVATVWYPYEEHVSNCLMLGTITTGTNAANCYAIVADCSGGEGCNPLTNIANCYYDATLCGCQALPATQTTHPTVAGLTTAQLTSGQQSIVNLTSDERKGFVLVKGYYPRVASTGHWARLALLDREDVYSSYIQNRASDLTAFLGNASMLPAYTDNLTDDGIIRPQLYHTGAWLASLPLTMEQGDLAYDFVATVTGKQQLGLWTERRFDATEQQWLEREVRQSSTVNIPKNATCIKVSGQKATAYDKGHFTLTLNASTLVRPAGFDIVSLGTPWNGETATAIRFGSGSPVDPYLIRSPQELAYAVQHCEEGMHYHQLCDLWLNERMIDTDGQFLLINDSHPRSDRHTWLTGTTWSGHYDGKGHYIRGLYFFVPEDITDQAYGLFGTVTANAEVKNLGVIDVDLQSIAWEEGPLDAYNFCHNAIGLLAGICEGHILNCLAQGAINGYRRVYSKVDYIQHPYMKMDYIGGLCGIVGKTNPNALVEDCVSAVTIQAGYSVAGAFTTRIPDVCKGKVRHSLALSPQIYYGYYVDDKGIKYDQESSSLGESDCLTDCHYPKGYRYMGPTTGSSDDSGDNLTALQEAFQNSSLWTTDDNYYPMLRSFSQTFGQLLTLPFEPSDGDNLPDVRRQIIFNPGGLEWNLFTNGSSDYFELDSDLGVLIPRKEMTYYQEKTWMPMMYGQTTDRKELVILQFGTSYKDVQPGIIFEDENARQLCLAFDSNNDDNITLSEIGSISNEDVITAFKGSKASSVKRFPELRWFKAVTALTTQLQAMSSLEHVQLPFALRSIDSDAFSGCTSLKEVTLPAKVSTVDGHPFYGSGVENVYVDKFNEDFKSRDGILFDTDNRLVAYPNGRTGSATLSGDVSEIVPGALYRLQDCDTIFIDAPNYWDVAYLNEGGIESADGSLPLVYINDATYDQTLLDSYLYDDSWEDYALANRLGRYYPLTVTSAKAATFYIGFDTQLPNGVKPYVVSSMEGGERGVAYLTRLTNIKGDMTMQVPELTPVIVFADKAGLYKLFPLDNEKLDLFPMWQNRLSGSDRDGYSVYQEDSASGNVLTLGRNSSGELGFFYYTGERVPPYHAYITLNDITDSRSFTLLFDDPSGIDAVQDSDSHEHLTLTHESVYDLQGRPVVHPQRGSLYIKNGQKFVMK